MSYNGRINFGLIGDYDALDDLDALAGDLSASLDELGAAAPAEPKRRSLQGLQRPRRKPPRAGEIRLNFRLARRLGVMVRRVATPLDRRTE